MGRHRPTGARDREKRWGGEGDSGQSRGIAAPRWVAWRLQELPGRFGMTSHPQAELPLLQLPLQLQLHWRGERRGQRSPRAHLSSATARRRTRSSSAIREGTSMDWRWADARQQALTRAESRSLCWLLGRPGAAGAE